MSIIESKSEEVNELKYNIKSKKITKNSLHLNKIDLNNESPKFEFSIKNPLSDNLSVSLQKDPNELNKSKEVKNLSTGQVYLCRKKRMYVFILLSLTNVVLNLDHGTIPAASNEIMKELNIDEATLGTFGSLVYFGFLLGSLLLIKIIDSFNRKKMTIIATIFMAILMLTFTEINNIYFLFINRVLVGVSQSFITIYFPVWIDQFGMRSHKTVMMAVFNITSPLGVVIGFVLTMSVKVNFNVIHFNLVEVILYYSSNNNADIIFDF